MVLLNYSMHIYITPRKLLSTVLLVIYLLILLLFEAICSELLTPLLNKL